MSLPTLHRVPGPLLYAYCGAIRGHINPASNDGFTYATFVDPEGEVWKASMSGYMGVSENGVPILESILYEESYYSGPYCLDDQLI